MIFFKFVWLSGRISDVSPAKSAKHLPQWFGSRRLAEAHFEVWKARQWLMGGLFGNTVCSFQLRKFLLPSPNWHERRAGEKMFSANHPLEL